MKKAEPQTHEEARLLLHGISPGLCRPRTDPIMSSAAYNVHDRPRNADRQRLPHPTTATLPGAFVPPETAPRRDTKLPDHSYLEVDPWCSGHGDRHTGVFRTGKQLA